MSSLIPSTPLIVIRTATSQIIVALIFLPYKKLWLNKTAKRQCQIIKKSPLARTGVWIHIILIFSVQGNKSAGSPVPCLRDYNHNLVTVSDNKWHILTILTIPFLYVKKSCSNVNSFCFLSHFYSTSGLHISGLLEIHVCFSNYLIKTYLSPGYNCFLTNVEVHFVISSPIFKKTALLLGIYLHKYIVRSFQFRTNVKHELHIPTLSNKLYRVIFMRQTVQQTRCIACEVKFSSYFVSKNVF